jgi:hypothetical protein
VLKAVPIEAFNGTPELHARRWPQVLADVGRRRTAMAKLANRVSDARPPRARKPVAARKKTPSSKPPRSRGGKAGARSR